VTVPEGSNFRIDPPGGDRLVLDPSGHREGVAGPEHDRGLCAVGSAHGDVELAVEDQEEPVGVLVDMPHVLALRVRDAHVVVHPGHDPRAVDVVEPGCRCRRTRPTPR